MYLSDKQYRQSLRHLSETAGQSIVDIARAYTSLHGNSEECPVNATGWSATTISKESRGQVPSKRSASPVFFKITMNTTLGNYKRGGTYFFISESYPWQQDCFYQFKAYEFIPVVLDINSHTIETISIYNDLMYVPKEDFLVYRTFEMMVQQYKEMMI